MPKGTSCKNAIAGFEGVKGVVAAASEKVSLSTNYSQPHQHAPPPPLNLLVRPSTMKLLLTQVDLAGVNPPIEKMDAALGSLKACRCAQETFAVAQ